MNKYWGFPASLGLIGILGGFLYAGGGTDQPQQQVVAPVDYTAPQPPAPPSEKRQQELKDLKFTPENYPRVDGSTTGHPLSVLIACKLTGVPCEWSRGMTWDEMSERRLMPIDPAKHAEYLSAVAATKKEAQTRPSVWPGVSQKYIDLQLYKKTRHTGTNEGYIGLITGKNPRAAKGTVDRPALILVARPPSPDELALARQKKVELKITPVALDAFVFLLHKDNQVKAVTTKHIRDIYTGKIVSWKEVGGKNEAIHALQRERNSGSQEMMEALVMKGRKMIHAQEMILMSMMGPYNRLNGDKAGIGYTYFYYNQFMVPSTFIKMAEVDGVAPTADTIASRKYPYVTGVYAVTRVDAGADSPAAKIIDWLLTPAGQACVAQSGYVPILPAKESPKP